jgi:hypothetical protein
LWESAGSSSIGVWRLVFGGQFFTESQSVPLSGYHWIPWLTLLHIVKDVVVVFREAFSRDLSIHPFVSTSIHGWHHTGKKTLTEINNPPPPPPPPHAIPFLDIDTCAWGGGRAPPRFWYQYQLLSHGSQAVQTSRFSVARVPMNTCGMWYIERFWKCSCSYNFVICTVKYTHTHLCIRHGVQTSLVIIEIPWLTFITPGIIFAMASSLMAIF